MLLPLVSTVPKSIDINPKSLFSLDSIAKRWLKIVLHISSKNVAIAIRFIIAIAVLKAEAALLDMGKLIPASKKTIEHCKFNR